MKRIILLIFAVTLVLFAGLPYAILKAEGWGDVVEGEGNSSSGETDSSANEVSATTKVAENNRFTLFVDEKFGQLRIQEKATGKDWFGTPQADKALSSSNLSFIQSPVHIRYTEGTSNTQTYPSKEKNMKIAMERIDNGVRFTYDLPSIKLAFAVVYKLTDTGFEVNIPFDSIKETGTARLTSLEILPFFDAATSDDEGAIFIPDGSGTLIRFQENHPEYFNGYSEFVYGGDPVYRTKVNEEVLDWITRAQNPKESVALPVYGIYKKDHGFLAVISKGEHDAKINAAPSGLKNIDFYHSSVEFMYRNDDVIFIGNSGEIPIYQGNKVEGDRTVKFILLNKDQADYVGMAKAYRDYLINERGLKPTPQPEVPFQLRLFGGVFQDEIIGTSFVKMTTFKQAMDLIGRLKAQGIDRMEVTYKGWSDGGEIGNQPNHFPASGKLGGNGGLKELAAYAKSNGIDLYLSTNYLRPYSESDHVRASRDAIRGLDRDILTVNNYFVATRYSKFREKFYFLKADKVFKQFIAPESKEFVNTGVAGVHFDYMGNILYSDQDPKHLTDRSQTAETWVKAMDLMREKNEKVAVDYGFSYTFGHIDRIDNIPLDSSHFIYTSEAVPFYQIAIHGLIPYTATPSNLRDDPRTGLLRMLEYGAVPSFVMTHEPTRKLKRTMMNGLFSTEYQKLIEPSVAEYKEVAAFLNEVASEPIVKHEKLSPRVFKTTYGNGMQVIVNYNYESAVVQNEEIKAFGYLVKKGEDGA